VVTILSIAVCDDEVMECCRMSGKIKNILEEMKILCMIRQFYNGQELLQVSESFDIVFLDIMMCGLDGMKTAQIFRKKACERLQGDEIRFVNINAEAIKNAFF